MVGICYSAFLLRYSVSEETKLQPYVFRDKIARPKS